MNDEVIPLEKLGKRGTLTLYNQAYVEKLEARIAHLTRHLEPQSMTTLFEQVEEEVKQEQRIKELEKKISILLSCKNCPDNKGGLLCQKEYEDKCLAQKTQYIKELQEELKKWKDEWQEQVQKENDESYARTLQTIQLNKAKELIKNIIRVTWNEGWNYSLDVKVKAEQFLKEAVVDS